jgi:hypothetical protein
MLVATRFTKLGAGTTGCVLAPAPAACGPGAGVDPARVAKVVSVAEPGAAVQLAEEASLGAVLQAADPGAVWFYVPDGVCPVDLESPFGQAAAAACVADGPALAPPLAQMSMPRGGPTLGTLLAQWWRDGPEEAARLAPARVAFLNALFAHLLQGLVVMHAAGVVHLDIKPDNVVLGEDPAGPPGRYIDFGMGVPTVRARLLAEQPQWPVWPPFDTTLAAGVVSVRPDTLDEGTLQGFAGALAALCAARAPEVAPETVRDAVQDTVAAYLRHPDPGPFLDAVFRAMDVYALGLTMAVAYGAVDRTAPPGRPSTMPPAPVPAMVSANMAARPKAREAARAFAEATAL